MGRLPPALRWQSANRGIFRVACPQSTLDITHAIPPVLGVPLVTHVPDLPQKETASLRSARSSAALPSDWQTTRRRTLQCGALAPFGLGLPQLLAAESSAHSGHLSSGESSKNAIVIWLSGGPPQHETFDPKPQAPVSIRGEFAAIPTTVPGMEFSELLPRTAGVAEHLCVIRSCVTNNYIHSASGYWMLTGHEHSQMSIEIAGMISPADHPCLGAIATRLLSQQGELPTSITLPELMKNNPGVLWPGQDSGYLGPAAQPLILTCDPNSPAGALAEFSAAGDPALTRLSDRRRLLEQLDQRRTSRTSGYDSFVAKAANLLTGENVRRAFELEHEPASLRDQYGRHKFGQSCLLARRLIEAGTRLVHVNYPREPGDLTVGNPVWDTHQQNFQRCKDMLCPTFDSGYAALITDLAERGLLEQTLVVVMGEFGRSPQINVNAGREHWGGVFSVVLAGGGVRGGQVYGASDDHGGYPKTNAVLPPDLHATIFRGLGLPENAEVTDRLGRPIPVYRGHPLEVFG